MDLALGAALVAVPLAFHPGVREFSVFKVLVLAVCVGAALVALALSRSATTGSRRSLLALLPAAHVLVVLAWRPSFGGVEQAMALMAPMLLAWLLASRVGAWSSRRLVLLLALPLGVDLGWSLLQVAGIGVLPATAAAFGTTHGHAVGTVGNPNENCWYLVLAATLLGGSTPRPWRRGLVWAVPVVLAVLVVVFVDRSRAVLLALIVGAGTWVLLTPSVRARWGRWTLAGLPLAALVVGLGLAWGGGAALAGRVYLARIELSMLAHQAGGAAGLGSFAPDFVVAQADYLAAHADQIRWLTRLDHAHDDVLELVYELGVPALAWMLALVAAIWKTARTATRLQRAAVVCLAEGLVLSLFGYPLFSPASAVVLALALALCLADAPARGASWPGRVAALLLGTGLLVIAVRRTQSERLVTQALQAAYEGDGARADALADRARAAWPVR